MTNDVLPDERELALIAAIEGYGKSCQDDMRYGISESAATAMCLDGVKRMITALAATPLQAKQSPTVADEAEDAFPALHALTEAILTRADPDYMQRQLAEAVRIMATRGWTPPVPFPAPTTANGLTKEETSASTSTGEASDAVRNECAAICDEIAKNAREMADSKFVTEAGRQLHEGMWGGAFNCAASIRAALSTPTTSAIERPEPLSETLHEMLEALLKALDREAASFSMMSRIDAEGKKFIAAHGITGKGNGQ